MPIVFAEAANSTATSRCEWHGYVVTNYTPVYNFVERDVAALVKRERAIESARIAAALEPLPLAPPDYVPRVMRPTRQPPGRFAYYQGEF